MKIITPKQAAVLDFIKAYFARKQRTPTFAEINAEFGWVANFASRRHVHALCEQKQISVVPKVWRGIRVLESA